MKKFTQWPALFFIAILLLAGILETGIMLAFHYFQVPEAIADFADAILIVIFLAPVVYVFSFRPWLRAKQMKERLLLLAPDAIITLSPSGLIKTLNHAAEKIFGYPPDELIGKHFMKAGIVAAASLPKAVDELALALEGQERPPFEIEMIRKNGGIRPLEVHQHLIQHAGKKSNTLLVILRDISKRKKAEAALRESEKRYRILTESAQDAIFLIDLEERLLYLNAHGASWFKTTTDKVLGKSMKELFPESYDAVRKNFQTIFSTKKPLSVQQEIKFPIGLLYVDARIIPMLDQKGEIYCLTGISRDITERRRTEALTMLQAEALEAVSTGIAITDPQGTITWVNAAFTRMTGYPFEEAVGKNPRILKSGEQPLKTYQELWATILSGNSWSGELINRRKDGTLYFEFQTITPVKNDEGNVTHFIAIKQDISGTKKLEAQFRQAQKMEAVGRLAGGVAHDFNNLLTIMLGYSDLLMRELEPDSPSHHFVTEIKQSALRASNLTRQLLAFSRKQIFQMKLMDINEIIRGADKMLRRLVGEDIEFVTLFGENLKLAKVDQGQIEQVLMNLTVNARDAMPRGGKLVIATSQVTVDAGQAAKEPGFEPGEYLLIKVSDTGSGLSPEAKAHLFEPFFTTKEKGKGTGLGLATCYGIVKQSRGFIYAESESGKGTTFLIYLPVINEEPALAAEGADIPKLPEGSETILIAEDEPMVHALMSQILTRQGFHILEANNGLEALKIARAHQGLPIQLLITDMVMPFMGGHELAEKFLAAFPETKIIFTSGYTDNSAVQKWLDRGYRFLQKPYTQTELLLLVGKVLDKK